MDFDFAFQETVDIFLLKHIYVHDLIHFFFNKKSTNSDDEGHLELLKGCSNVCVQSKRGRANNVTCRFCDATVRCCSSTQAYVIVGRNVL